MQNLANPIQFNGLVASLPADLHAAVNAVLDDWFVNNKPSRLWSGDATLWSGTDEANWLGWLRIVSQQLANTRRFSQIAADAQRAGFAHVLLLGMGGSSLCPELLAATFNQPTGYPKLLVLDSTDPVQINAVEAQLDLRRTLFIVSSKSGTTLEPDCLKRHFFGKLVSMLGLGTAPQHFIAITDPGTPLEQAARAEQFRAVYHGIPTIGGRFSALSDFGMVPAAVMGVDVPKLLARAEAMACACGDTVPAHQNPAVLLGAILGAAHNLGRNKLTIVVSPAIRAAGAWLEQLIAESTGKSGRAIVPVDGEELRPARCYGTDRLFVYLRLESAPDPTQDMAIHRLEHAGEPVVQIALADVYDIAREFFRWEFATAVAGSVIGVNPFNQPDVEAAKAAAREVTAAFERTGLLQHQQPLCEEARLKLFADCTNAAALKAAVGEHLTLTGLLRAHLNRARPGDYFALLAFTPVNSLTQETLQSIRHAVLDAKHIATCVGFGPRFLHSTGQMHKGGPNTGLFLQITCDDPTDLPVPGRKYSFGVVKAAQAQGDFEVLAARGRRLLRVHLPDDLQTGLAMIEAAVKDALARGFRD